MNLILGGFGKVRLGAGKPGLFQVQHANPGAGCGCNLGDEDLTIHTAAPVEGGLVQGPPCCEAGGGVIARHGFPPLTPPESTGIARHPRLQGLRRGLLKEKALHVLCINPGLTGPCIIPESPAGPLWWEGADQGLIRAGGCLAPPAAPVPSTPCLGPLCRVSPTPRQCPAMATRARDVVHGDGQERGTAG